MRSKVVFQVHDSIMADVHKDEFDDYLDIAKKVMCHDLKEHWDWIITPLAIEGEASEINGSWAKMKTAIEYSN